jgi:hypothetical protein
MTFQRRFQTVPAYCERKSYCYKQPITKPVHIGRTRVSSVLTSIFQYSILYTSSLWLYQFWYIQGYHKVDHAVDEMNCLTKDNTLFIWNECLLYVIRKWRPGAQLKNTTFMFWSIFPWHVYKGWQGCKNRIRWKTLGVPRPFDGC